MADAVAAQAGIPRRSDITAMPASAQTFPGTYLAMLESSQTDDPSNQGSGIPSRRPSVARPRPGGRIRPRPRAGPRAVAGSADRQSRWASRTSFQFRETYRTTKRMTARPRMICAAWMTRLRTDASRYQTSALFRDSCRRRRTRQLRLALRAAARAGRRGKEVADARGDASGQLGSVTRTASVPARSSNPPPSLQTTKGTPT